MPALRHDPISNRWIIVARERAARPQPRIISAADTSALDCPFCGGHESRTPPESFSLRSSETSANENGWRVRVMGNKYPALGPMATTAPRFVDGRPAMGAHEVVVESPHHVASAGALGVAQWHDIVLAYRQRLEYWSRQQGMRYALLFKNVGAAAGASQQHIHSQLAVLPVVPPAVEAELDGAHTYYKEHARCVFCDLVKREMEEEVRLVAQTERFVAFCPYAGRFPFETWLMPRHHAPYFERLPNSDTEQLATILREVLCRVEACIQPVAYNCVFHTSPFDTHDLSHYHWHIEITPRMTTVAGFELGSGLFINPLPPEDAAAILRASSIPPQIT
jgi:UDPglucose--hexose-1-phosphate uridylyltransferase